MMNTTQAWCYQEATRSLILENKNLVPLQADEVRIENRAIGLNPVDFKVIRNDVLTQGQTAGVDGAGVIVEVGSENLKNLIGKRVAYHQNLRADGSFAKHVQLKANVVIQIPDTLSFNLASSLPCPLMTAWQAVEKIPAQQGRSVLVSGASGSVGRYLIQLLARRGFVVSITATKARHDQLIKLGATHAYEMDESFDDKAFFAVFDTRSPQSAESLLPTIQANGHLICIQGRIVNNPAAGFSRCVSIHEIALGALHQEGSSDDWQALTSSGGELFEDVVNGKLIACDIHSTQFEQLADALHEFEHQRKALKYVISVN